MGDSTDNSAQGSRELSAQQRAGIDKALEEALVLLASVGRSGSAQRAILTALLDSVLQTSTGAGSETTPSTSNNPASGGSSPKPAVQTPAEITPGKATPGLSPSLSPSSTQPAVSARSLRLMKRDFV